MNKSFSFKNVVTFLILIFSFSASSLAQTPQYYNYNSPTGSNYFPFGVVAGKQVQWLFLKHEWNTPSVAPPGNIDTLYIMMSYTNGNVTLTDLTIKMGLTTITTLPAGVIYTGPLDTVYFRASVNLTSTIGSWMAIPLDRAFNYTDTSKNLVLDISQCGATNITMLVSQTTLAPIRRTAANHTGSCTFSESYQGGEILNSGVHISPPIPPTPPYFNYNNGSSTNIFPFGVAAGKECQWLIRPHSLNQPSQSPSGIINALYFWMGSTASATFTSLLVKLGSTTLTDLPAGVIYTGQLDTVYYRASVTFSSTNNTWMLIPLDRAWPYDTSQSIVVDVRQCGATSGSVYVHQTTGSGLTRNYINHSGGCVFAYAGQDASIINFGVNISGPLGIERNRNHTVPTAYSLEQNYPNPFNPTTTIRFAIPKAGNVSLRIYDELGREVATLVNEYKQAGAYSVEFNADKYASGLYFYKIMTGNFVETKKMMLVK